MAQAIRVQEATRESNEKEVPLMEKIHRYSEAIPECELAKIPSDLSLTIPLARPESHRRRMPGVILSSSLTLLQAPR